MKLQKVSRYPKTHRLRGIGAARVRIRDRDREELDDAELGTVIGRRDHRWQRQLRGGQEG